MWQTDNKRVTDRQQTCDRQKFIISEGQLGCLLIKYIKFKYMGKLKISESLRWAITHKNPSNSFHAITTKNKEIEPVTDRQTDNQQTCNGQMLLFLKDNQNTF